MIFAGIYKSKLSVINVFPSIQCFCLNISEMNRIESTSYSVLITRGISRYHIMRCYKWVKVNLLTKIFDLCVLYSEMFSMLMGK